MEAAVCHGVSRVICHEAWATLGATHDTQNRHNTTNIWTDIAGYHHQSRVGHKVLRDGDKTGEKLTSLIRF